MHQKVTSYKDLMVVLVILQKMVNFNHNQQQMKFI
jgi:hypothetical protein